MTFKTRLAVGLAFLAACVVCLVMVVWISIADGLYADAHGTSGTIGPGAWVSGTGVIVFLVAGIAILQGPKPKPE